MATVRVDKVESKPCVCVFYSPPKKFQIDNEEHPLAEVKPLEVSKQNLVKSFKISAH